jgi:hypothetical protein
MQLSSYTHCELRNFQLKVAHDTSANLVLTRHKISAEASGYLIKTYQLGSQLYKRRSLA